MAELPPITFCRRLTRVGGWGERHVASALEEAGYCVTTVSDGPLKVTRDGVVFVMNTFSWFPRIRRQLAATPPAQRPLVVVWQTEPLPLPSAAAFGRPPLQPRELAKIILRDSRATDVFTNYFHLRQLARSGIPDLLIVSTPSSREFLAEKGISAHLVLRGYHAAVGHDLRTARDIDVLFLGTLDDARHRRSIGYLKRHGVNVLAKGSWTDPACWSDERTKLINRANIFLALQRRPGTLSGERMMLGMANKALVVSEPIYNSAPYVSGRHFVSAALDTMPEVIDRYLRNDTERERIVDEAYRFLNEEVTHQRSIACITGLLEQRWAATR